MYIETPRMIVRDFVPEDAADLHDIFGDDETMENCEPAYDFEKTKEFLTSFCIGRNGAVAAVHKESGKMMGYILFKEHARMCMKWAGSSTVITGGKAMPMSPARL